MLIDLMILLEENEYDPEGDDSSASSEMEPMVHKFQAKSMRFQDLTTNPHIWAFLTATISDIKRT